MIVYLIFSKFSFPKKRDFYFKLMNKILCFLCNLIKGYERFFRVIGMYKKSMIELYLKNAGKGKCREARDTNESLAWIIYAPLVDHLCMDPVSRDG